MFIFFSSKINFFSSSTFFTWTFFFFCKNVKKCVFRRKHFLGEKMVLPCKNLFWNKEQKNWRNIDSDCSEKLHQFLRLGRLLSVAKPLFWFCFTYYSNKFQFYKNNWQTSWVFVTNSNFPIVITLQPDVVDLGYFKLWILVDQIVWNIKGFQYPVAEILGLENLDLWQKINSFSSIFAYEFETFESLSMR